MILILTTQIMFFSGGDAQETGRYAAEAESMATRAVDRNGQAC